MARYSVICGNHFRTYTGTVSCTGLFVAGTCDTKDEAKDIVNSQFDNGNQLHMVIDLETGEPADMS
jgi:hypothetical protein